MNLFLIPLSTTYIYVNMGPRYKLESRSSECLADSKIKHCFWMLTPSFPSRYNPSLLTVCSYNRPKDQIARWLSSNLINFHRLCLQRDYTWISFKVIYKYSLYSIASKNKDNAIKTVDSCFINPWHLFLRNQFILKI